VWHSFFKSANAFELHCLLHVLGIVIPLTAVDFFAVAPVVAGFGAAALGFGAAVLCFGCSTEPEFSVLVVPSIVLHAQ